MKNNNISKQEIILALQNLFNQENITLEMLQKADISSFTLDESLLVLQGITFLKLEGLQGA